LIVLFSGFVALVATILAASFFNFSYAHLLFLYYIVAGVTLFIQLVAGVLKSSSNCNESVNRQTSNQQEQESPSETRADVVQS
jgi:hypothetical protein